MRETTLDAVKGLPVIDNRGVTLGSVQDVLLDLDDMRVGGIVVDLDRAVADDLHLAKGGLFAGRSHLTIGRERVAAIADNVVLNVDTDEIAMLLRDSHRTDLPPG